MYKLNYAEFYITNVCNLNCTNCNRFNNYTFKGHFNWSDYEQEYIKWSKIVDIDTIGILGGEPFLNSDLFNWSEGILKLWPNARVAFITNGTQLKRYENLYQELLKHNGRLFLEINHHTPKTWNNIHTDITEFLQGPIRYETRNKQQDWEPTDHVDMRSSMKFIDVNNIEIHLNSAWNFKQSALLYDKQTNTVKPFESNAELAIASCDFKNCHHFIRGKLYKCGPVGILPDFISQFKVELTDRQRQLIDNYSPAQSDWDKEQLDNFMDNLINAKSIPQCSLCPQNTTIKPFSATTKKIIRIQEIA